MPDLTMAAQLKNEGNELFRKQDYGGALAKYSEALSLDEKNAVLYANRAACNYGLNKYLDAVDDAKMATELDSGYAKGWSRLATARDALADWQKSAVAWQKALDILPTSNLSPAEQQQKHQYSAGLKAAQARIEAAKEPIVPHFQMNENAGKFPWQVAAEMLPELRRTASATNYKNLSSSVWVIAYAYEDFTQGVELMKGLQRIRHPGAPDGFAYHGNLDALTYLTNGLLRDDRVFHINQPDWLDMYGKQVMFEATACQAWDEGLETIKELAQKRLKEKGWNDVRPALSVTVRAWIMNASLKGGLGQQPQASVQYFNRALDLLEWGRNIWKNVPKSDRGTIFEDTFVTGVRGLYLKMFMEAYYTDPGLNSKFPLENLKEEAVEITASERDDDGRKTRFSTTKQAEDLLKETDRLARNPTKDEVDPGFVSSFISYPAGIAHSMIGLYHAQTAQYSSDLVERMFSFMNGASAYLDAAKKYSEDDELHAWYLNCTLDLMRNAGVSIGDFNQVAAGLREAAPKMRKIWALSVLAYDGRDQKIQANLDHAEDIMRRVAEGKLTLDDPVPLR